ncbi:MAG: DUF1275 domain-containing protein [Deltaproteobacteria bacterium]|nr:DUF1275 domain-containing protein [Deltaproteobacteria bacterium]
MFRHRASEEIDLKTLIDWFLLSFLAGNINTGGYLACQRFVSHVTGFATLAGVDAAVELWWEALGILTVPAFFLLGVLISAYYVDRRVHEGKKPRYALVMGFATLCLVLAGGGGVAGLWGDFGHELEITRDYAFLALLCMASGLQNAALSSSSGSTLRTTHLTGTTTDLGIGLMRWATLSEKDTRRGSEMKGNFLRIGLIFSFMVGSGIGAVLFIRYQYWGFSLPIAIAGYATYKANRRAAGDQLASNV